MQIRLLPPSSPFSPQGNLTHHHWDLTHHHWDLAHTGLISPRSGWRHL